MCSSDLSEHYGRTTESIVIRGNNVSNSYQANIMMGGYDAKRGKSVGITVENNTLANGRDGEIIIQYNANGVQIKGNQFRARGINIFVRGSNNANILVQGNQYSPKPSLANDLALKDGRFRQIQDQK